MNNNYQSVWSNLLHSLYFLHTTIVQCRECGWAIRLFHISRTSREIWHWRTVGVMSWNSKWFVTYLCYARWTKYIVFLSIFVIKQIFNVYRQVDFTKKRYFYTNTHVHNMYIGILIIINVCSNMIKILIFVTTFMEYLK